MKKNEINIVLTIKKDDEVETKENQYQHTCEECGNDDTVFIRTEKDNDLGIDATVVYCDYCKKEIYLDEDDDEYQIHQNEVPEKKKPLRTGEKDITIRMTNIKPEKKDCFKCSKLVVLKDIHTYYYCDFKQSCNNFPDNISCCGGFQII